MRTVKITPETHAMIAARAIGPFDGSTAVATADGMLEVPLSDEVLTRLEKLSPDPDVALRTLFSVSDGQRRRDWRS